MKGRIDSVLHELIQGIIVCNDHGEPSLELIQDILRRFPQLLDHMRRAVGRFLRRVCTWTRITTDSTFEEKVTDMQGGLPHHGVHFSCEAKTMLETLAGLVLRGRGGRDNPFKTVFSPEHDDTAYIASRVHHDVRGQQVLSTFANLVASFLRGKRNPAAMYQDVDADAAQYARGVQKAVLDIAPQPVRLVLDPNDDWAEDAMPGAMTGGVSEETEPAPVHQPPALPPPPPPPPLLPSEYRFQTP